MRRLDGIAGRAAALVLALLLCVQTAAPVLAADGSTLYIGTAEELAALSERCALDSWSRGKTVVLTRDISLASVDFLPIATFGGTFDGGGHTISGLNVSGRISPAGLFGVLQEGAVVRGLNVNGTVSPAGTRGRVGGIAGENHGEISNCAFTGIVTGKDAVGGVAGLNGPTGQIDGCTVSGSVTGSSMTGGVAGEDRGVIVSCVNRSYVNITGADPGVDLSGLELSTDILTLKTLDAANISTDTGGVAGLTTGVILNCVNHGSVGYPHVGYNVGGIAGRSSGFISGCVNHGEVLGRKDIGGIVGQAEPYVVLNVSESALETIRGQLEQLEQLVDRAAADAQDAAQDLTDRFSAVNDCLDDTAAKAQALADKLSGYGGGVVSEVNRGAAVLSDALGQLSGIAHDADGISDAAVHGLEVLEQSVRQLAASGDYADEVVDALLSAADHLSAASALLGSGAEKLSRGVEELTGSVQIRDEEAAQEALEQIADGAGELASAMEELSIAMGGLSEAVSGGDLDGARDALAELSGIFANMAPAFQKISDGAQALREDVTFDLAAARSGLALIRDGMGELASAPAELDRALNDLKRSLSGLSGLSGQVQRALDTMADALDILEDVGTDAGGSLREMRELIDWLAAIDPIRLARPDEVLQDASDALFDALARLGDSLDRLDRAAGSEAGRLAGDLRAINSQFSLLTDTLLDAVEDLEQTGGADLIADTSEEDIDAVTSGKVRACRNEGAVSGDLCVGGVAGSLAVEHELDPEDDALDAGAPIYRRAYELKAILQDCVDTGPVTGRRDLVGGVCGRASLGLIVGCQGYGTVESVSGDYVGGVAGLCSGAVRGCFAKCTLSGGKYVGGIVGAAGPGGDGGVVTRSVSFVKIARCEQASGAISGGDSGSFRDNRFVSDELAGIGRTSLAGQAEPLTYEEMLEIGDLPDPFRELMLRFLAGGQVIKSVPFHYGESFGADVFPDIPAVTGSYAEWDRTELTGLRFDTDVSAVYAPCRTALGSEETRSDGRPVLFVEGRFSGGDALSLQTVLEEFDIPRSLFSLRRTVELWQLSIPEDGLSSHTVRYLSPSGDPSRLEVYLLDGTWQKLDAEIVGSYLIFDVEGSRPALAVCSRLSIWWAWAVAGVLVLAAAAAVVLALRALVRRRKAGKKAAAPDPKPQMGKKKRRLRRVLTAAGVVLVCLCGVYAFLSLSGLLDGLRATRILVAYARQDTFSMELNVQADLGGRRLSTDTALQHVEQDGKSVICARQLGADLYYCDGAVYLENGAAFRLSSAGLPDYTQLLDTLHLLYRTGDISVFRNNSETIYGLTVAQEGAQALLRAFLPEMEELGELDCMDIELAARSGALSELRFSAEGMLADGRPAALSVRLTAQEDAEPWAIPERVRQAILSGELAGEQDAAGLGRLVAAWAKLNLTDPLSVQLSLSADCGPLVLNDELELFRTWVNGKQVGCVRRAGRSLYFSEGTLYSENGTALSSGTDGDAIARARLLELVHRLSFQTEIRSEERDGLCVYTLLLTPEEQAEAARAILPAAEALTIAFDQGRLEVTVADNEIARIQLSCGGDLLLLSAHIPASLSCTMCFEPHGSALPAAVVDALQR